MTQRMNPNVNTGLALIINVSIIIIINYNKCSTLEGNVDGERGNV